jgi:MFS transporter, DHA2 family, multidrug resistance protein
MSERPRQDEDEWKDIPSQERDGSTQQNVLADDLIVQETSAPATLERRQWRILVACCVLIFAKMAAPPLSVLIPPAPPQAFGAQNLAFRLTTSGSTLVFMAFLLIGGVLGDLYGRRRLLLVGSISFVLANVLCILSTGLPLFVVSRLLVGASSALMVPLILAVMRLAFPPRQRIIAIGIYTAVVGIGTAVGPLTAQLLIQFADWRTTYLLSIACGSVGTVLAWRSIQESRVAGGMRRGDAIGTVAWSAVLLSLLFGLLEINIGVFAHIYTTLALLLGVWGLAVLAWLQLRPAGKILYRTRVNKRALAIIIVAGCALNGVFIGSCLELYSFLRSVQGYGVVQIILAFAPLLPALLIPILISARLAGRVDERTQTAAGFLLLAVGTFALSFIGHQTSYWSLLFPLIVLGMGYSATSTHLTNAFMSMIAPDLAGTAAGTNNAYTQVGNSVGATALAAGILWFGNAAYAAVSNLPPKEIRQHLAYMSQLTVRTLTQGSPSVLPDNLHELGVDYQAAYAQGLGETLLVAAGICLAMGVLVWFGLRRVAIYPDQES